VIQILLLASLGITALGAAACSMPFLKGRVAPLIGGYSAAAAGGAALLAAILVLVNGGQACFSSVWQLPFASFSLKLDQLSAFFVIPVSLVCGLAGIYGTGYMADEGNSTGGRLSWTWFLLLMGSMITVIAASNGILFLVAWETMTVSSFFLVTRYHEKGEVRRAGWIYLTASHIGTALILVLFAFPGAAATGSGTLVHPACSHGLFFLLALVGFGTKAGIVPLHVWLPQAHPAAPSHVSALMSGVMIKTGVYGLLRMLTCLGSPEQWPIWWGWVMIGSGAVSALYGILNALGQRDIKRILAYSSVENMGIVFIGLGVWMTGASTGNALMSSLGLAGALLHVWNHSIFKSLLFLGAGSVAKASGTRDIEFTGGLLGRMGRTGLAFFTGSAAIIGLPPLNGFTGEFLIYWGAFSAVYGDNGFHASVSGLLAITALALAGGLAMICFTRLFGTVFLGSPRSENAGKACETVGSMYIPMMILAVLCLAGGLLAHLVVGFLPGVSIASGTPEVLGRIALVSLALPAGMLLAGALRKILLSGRSTTTSDTWGCGYILPGSRMQYTASSFSLPALLLFRGFVSLRLTTRSNGEYFPNGLSLKSGLRDSFMHRLYEPLFRSLHRLSGWFSGMQHGRNQLYVLYMAAVLLILLLWELGV